MKRAGLLCLLMIQFIANYAKPGLEGIIVERYYVSDLNDEKGSDGKLVSGSVTYRVFVNMLPGYRFQAAYGIPGHPLDFTSSTNFFNDPEFGSSISNEVHSRRLKEGTTMLDSWLSVGSGADNYLATLKSLDTSSAMENKNGLLLNEDRRAGIPLKIRDGLFPAAPVPAVNFYGIDSTLLNVFRNSNQGIIGQRFYTENGSWASFGGSIGSDTSNCVLIAQITTNGIFSFHLNIQIGTPSGGVENYVAENPKNGELELKSLIYPMIETVDSKHRIESNSK